MCGGREHEQGISRGPKGLHPCSFHEDNRVDKSQVSQCSTDGVGRARDGPIAEIVKIKM